MQVSCRIKNKVKFIGDLNSPAWEVVVLHFVQMLLYKQWFGMFETWLPTWLNIISVTDFFSLFSSSVQEMTIPWCLKRAELVFKCVKGVQAKISNVKLSLIINILYQICLHSAYYSP